MADAETLLAKYRALTAEPPIGDIGRGFYEERMEFIAALEQAAADRAALEAIGRIAAVGYNTREAALDALVEIACLIPLAASGKKP